jgi:hypothetical protein
MATVKAKPATVSGDLVTITRREVDLYAGNVSDGKLFTLFDEKQKQYAVVHVGDYPREYPTLVVVMAQVVGDKVIILEDNTDKPLYEALMVNGNVPREQIILAYAGETLPEAKAE